MIGVLFISLAICLVLSIPIAVSLSISTVITAMMYYPERGLVTTLAQSLVTGSDSFTLMAMPFFMLVGTLMDRSGIAKRLIDVAEAIAGSAAGGLGTATIVAAMFFAAISGSGPAVVAALGAILIPAMVRRGYRDDYAAAVVASASTIGPVIPPSIPMIVYAVTAGVSVTEMFLAGVVPGIIMGIGLIVVNVFISKKRGYVGVPREGGILWVFSKVKSGALALIMPVMVLGGIYTGIVTPTESAVMGIIYSFIVGMFVYKELNFEKIKGALIEAGLLSAPVMILLGGANTFGRILTLARIPAQLTDLMMGITSNGVLILLMIMGFLLITGMFIDTTSNIVLFAPLFVPIISALGYNKIFFGILMTVNLCIGFLTPPLGMNLFVAQGVAGVSLEDIVRENMPFLIVLILVLLLFLLCPGLIMFLPNLVSGV